jgi:TctA family transporter
MTWGTLLGLIALFPGFHFAMILMAAGPMIITKLGITKGLLTMAWSVCIARSAHCLAVPYHPVAGDQLASASPAQRLTAAGQGRLATRIMSRGLQIGAIASAGIVMILLVMSQITHHNWTKMLLKTAGSFTVPVFILFVVFTTIRSKNKAGTILVIFASAILGIVALDHPSIKGSSHAMTPLLTGLFGLPVLVLTLLEKHQGATTLQAEPVEDPDTSNNPIGTLGILVGMISVAIAGIGTSSVVSLVQDLVEDDGEYLKLASIAESTGELLALTLGLLSLCYRSSDAAVIQRILTDSSQYEVGAVFPYVLMGTMIAATIIGAATIRVLEGSYNKVVNLVPQKVQAIAIASGMAWIVYTHTGMWGMAIMLVGTLIHIGARQLHTPNQAFFACLIGPMLLTYLGIA